MTSTDGIRLLVLLGSSVVMYENGTSMEKMDEPIGGLAISLTTRIRRKALMQMG